MAWVLLGGLFALVASMLAAALAEREAWWSGEVYRRYEVLSGNDWALTVLAMLCVAALAWLGIATLTRRITPVLTRDLGDADDPSA